MEVPLPDNPTLVREFCDLMAKRDAEAIRPYLAADAVHQNTGVPAAVGADAMVANLGAQFVVFPDSYQYR